MDNIKYAILNNTTKSKSVKILRHALENFTEIVQLAFGSTMSNIRLNKTFVMKVLIDLVSVWLAVAMVLFLSRLLLIYVLKDYFGISDSAVRPEAIALGVAFIILPAIIVFGRILFAVKLSGIVLLAFALLFLVFSGRFVACTVGASSPEFFEALIQDSHGRMEQCLSICLLIYLTTLPRVLAVIFVFAAIRGVLYRFFSICWHCNVRHAHTCAHVA